MVEIRQEDHRVIGRREAGPPYRTLPGTACRQPAHCAWARLQEKRARA